MTFTERLTLLLREKHLTRKQFLDDLHFGKNQFTYWEKNQTVPNRSTLDAIAAYFGVSPEFLLGTKKDSAIYKKEPSNIGAVMSGNIHLIPVFESVSAGFGTMAQEYVVDYYPCLIGSEAEAEETIIIRVKGDSMFPKIEDGDLIQVHKQSCVDSGEVAVVLVEGTDGFVKKVEYGENWVELHSFNPMYPVMRFTGTDIQKIRIIGRVKKVIKNI